MCPEPQQTLTVSAIFPSAPKIICITISTTHQHGQQHAAGQQPLPLTVPQIPVMPLAWPEHCCHLLWVESNRIKQSICPTTTKVITKTPAFCSTNHILSLHVHGKNHLTKAALLLWPLEPITPCLFMFMAKII